MCNVKGKETEKEGGGQGQLDELKIQRAVVG